MPRILPIRLLYFLSFAMMGAWLPFLSLYLTREAGWTEEQVGWLLALSSLSIMVTPVLVTLLADMHVQPRRLILLVNVLSCGSFLVLRTTDAFWLVAGVFLFYSLVSAPIVALQDGLFFSYGKTHPHTCPPFHRMRVFGTMGFICPSLVMFVLLQCGAGIRVMMTLAALICVLSCINTFFLPDVQRTAIKGGRLPTRDAMGVMLKRHVLFFSAGLWLMHMVSAAYYAFHSVWLRDVVHMEPKWIGLMTNLGVMIEIFFMLGFGLLMGKLGLRKLMVLGMICTAFRMAILTFCSSMPLVIFSQFFHGMMVLIVHVTPPVFLNANARQSFRSSIQGLFAMVIAGTGRVTGNLVAGYLAKMSLSILYGYTIVLCLLAAVIVFFGLRGWDMYQVHEDPPDEDQDESSTPPETSSLLGRPE